ncbi:NADH-quinone oxidoreductase subunit NuoE [Kaistia dalseonensis]|uniref:NADH-quinone oxidoreductase subunit E n=1 Tax=Kaistia dalseonensis TaxID=410840 RepID=A0ABU0H071_9HYPH|nr:NADH-quinone oxidoreductase subunit NuoE [Kaistia dalseonensis]MCX5493154.1 NADH-quinone oxidoreductase subunit NuoE [Kaistia dalseonensis]MDQ0435709.1 NADH-quinone oxidoreductase subunit E [Kaistia dalseonensis]
MSVRRLASEQPSSFAFTPENLAWAQKQLLKFPEGKQASAVIPILWRVQEQEGWVSEPSIRWVGEFLDMPFIRVLEIATFYTMFLLAPVGKKAHIQVCGTTPCMIRGAGRLLNVCRERIHHDPFHISANGDLSWEEVECLGACVNAPMVQIVPDTYEDLTVESFNKLIDDIEAGVPLKPGPQIARHYSAPETGFRVLTTESLYDGSMIGQGAGLAAARDAIAARAAAEAEAAKAAAEAAKAAADPAPAEAPAAPAVKAQAEADKEKVPNIAPQNVPASDPAVRPDAGKKE